MLPRLNYNKKSFLKNPSSSSGDERVTDTQTDQQTFFCGFGIYYFS